MYPTRNIYVGPNEPPPGFEHKTQDELKGLKGQINIFFDSSEMASDETLDNLEGVSSIRLYYIEKI